MQFDTFKVCSIGFAIAALLSTFMIPTKTSTADASNEIFGLVSGYEFRDLNRNSVDDDEPRVHGAKIRLSNIDGTKVELSADTDKNGVFSFDRLPIQKYMVCASTHLANCITVDLTTKEPATAIVFAIK